MIFQTHKNVQHFSTALTKQLTFPATNQLHGAVLLKMVPVTLIIQKFPTSYRTEINTAASQRRTSYFSEAKPPDRSMLYDLYLEGAWFKSLLGHWLS
jgi:hypothetical protein